MSIREGSYTVPAQAASVSRAARHLEQAFNDVFRYVPEAERSAPRRSLRRFCRTVLIGEQPAPVYWRRDTREMPGERTPDGDKYLYRDHKVDVRIDGGYDWVESDIPGKPHQRVLRISWYMESTYTYHATVDGEDVSGTLTEVWDRQTERRRRTLPPSVVGTDHVEVTAV